MLASPFSPTNINNNEEISEYDFTLGLSKAPGSTLCGKWKIACPPIKKKFIGGTPPQKNSFFEYTAKKKKFFGDPLPKKKVFWGTPPPKK